MWIFWLLAQRKYGMTECLPYSLFVCVYQLIWDLRAQFHAHVTFLFRRASTTMLGDNWTFFASYHGWGAMSRYRSKFCYLKGGSVTLNENFRRKRTSPPTIFGIRKVESLCYRMVKKIAEMFNRLSRLHQRHRQTDRRQTDGSAIAYSERGREFTFANKT